MADLFRLDERRMTIGRFLGFYEKRPDAEHWELVDGVPVMMTPPALAHQIIADNVARALWSLIEGLRLPLLAVRQIGLEIDGIDDFRPEPEVSVIDAAFELDQRHASRFEMVVEVISPSDRRTLARKMAWFRAHAPCHAILLVQPGEVRVDLHTRRADGWTAVTLAALDDSVEIPAWGRLCSLRDLYARTPLAR